MLLPPLGGADPLLDEPFVDGDQQQRIADAATGVTVDARVVRGGFGGTEARFVIYLPPAGSYAGRFFQSTYPTLTHEDVEPSFVAFALTHGAYVVSTNNAGGLMRAPDGIGAFRLNAAAAVASRLVAAEVYPDRPRPRGYICGASGGAYQTIGAMENTSDVWDGAVAMVPGTPNAIPNCQATQVLALRVLQPVLAQVADAMAPGGGGDPYAGLDPDQAAVLREVTRFGFPLRGWWQHDTLNGGSFSAVAGAVRALDPTFVDDFWSTPGYEGADPTSLAAAARVAHDTEVVSVQAGADTLTVTLAAAPPPGDLRLADLVVADGSTSGATLLITEHDGTRIQVAREPNASIGPGDAVRIDSSWVVALQRYFRHQVPVGAQRGWDHLRHADGAPLHPQRPILVGPILAEATVGSIPAGRFSGHMIVLASTMDVEAYPWMADWYRTQVEGVLGADTDARFRLWYMDNADHSDPATGRAEAHIATYRGELERALLDLDDWVSRAIAPPPTSGYRIDEDTQVVLAEDASERGGVQPLVTLTVGASDHIEVRAGGSVDFDVAAVVPPGGGALVAVEWDFDATGEFGVTEIVDVGPELRCTRSHAFSERGTHLVTVRVTAQRDGDRDQPYARVQNLSSVRVVVQ